MLILISTSKTQDFSPLPYAVDCSMPEGQIQAQQTAEDILSWSLEKIEKKMKISSKLAASVKEQFRGFSSASVKPALFAYSGTAFQQLELEGYSKESLRYAQGHLRIISGLYGLLRPLDGIKPYRYEMKLASKAVKSSIIEVLLGYDGPIINLASSESITPRDKKTLADNLVTIDFIQIRGNKRQRIAVYAKKARGMMVNWMIHNQIDRPEAFKKFQEDGYVFDENTSADNTYTFVRTIK